MPILRCGRLAVLLSFCTLAALTGCGKGGVNVSGKVTYKGAPLTAGTVILIDSLGAYHQGEIDATGNYKIEKVPAGGAKIGVTVPKSAAGKKAPPPRGGGKGEGAEDPGPKGGTPDARPTDGPDIPAKVRDPETSGITREVKSGTPIDIAID